jgi:hypothetical protein
MRMGNENEKREWEWEREGYWGDTMKNPVVVVLVSSCCRRYNNGTVHTVRYGTRRYRTYRAYWKKQLSSPRVTFPDEFLLASCSEYYGYGCDFGIFPCGDKDIGDIEKLTGINGILRGIGNG